MSKIEAAVVTMEDTLLYIGEKHKSQNHRRKVREAAQAMKDEHQAKLDAVIEQDMEDKQIAREDHAANIKSLRPAKINRDTTETEDGGKTDTQADSTKSTSPVSAGL